VNETDIHPEEITIFSEKFIVAARKIIRYRKEQDRIQGILQVSSSKDLRTLGRNLTIKENERKLSNALALALKRSKIKFDSFKSMRKNCRISRIISRPLSTI